MQKQEKSVSCEAGVLSCDIQYMLCDRVECMMCTDNGGKVCVMSLMITSSDKLWDLF